MFVTGMSYPALTDRIVRGCCRSLRLLMVRALREQRVCVLASIVGVLITGLFEMFAAVGSV